MTYSTIYKRRVSVCLSVFFVCLSWTQWFVYVFKVRTINNKWLQLRSTSSIYVPTYGLFTYVAHLCTDLNPKDLYISLKSLGPNVILFTLGFSLQFGTQCTQPYGQHAKNYRFSRHTITPFKVDHREFFNSSLVKSSYIFVQPTYSR